MHDYDDDWFDWATDEYNEDLLKQTGLQMIEDFFIRSAKIYKNSINDLIKNSKAIASINQFDMALVSVVIGLELLIRYFYLKPLIGGMFLNDDWFDFIYESKIVPDRSKDEKDLLRKLLSRHNIKSFDQINIKKKTIWMQLSEIYKIRNSIVHHGNKAGKEDYLIAMFCYEQLVKALNTIYSAFNFIDKKTLKLISEDWEA